MTTLSWPLLTRAAPGEMEWTLEANTQTFVSPLSRATQTVEMPGSRWRTNFTLRNLQVADTAILQAWMAQLRGQAGRFYLHHFARALPLGTLRGTPLVKGAAQSGTSLLIDGCTVGATLKAGDYFAVNSEFKIAVTDATASGAGEMTVTFEPPLRSSPADNAVVTVESPKAIMHLTDDAMRTLTRAPNISDIVIDAVEVWA